MLPEPLPQSFKLGNRGNCVSTAGPKSQANLVPLGLTEHSMQLGRESLQHLLVPLVIQWFHGTASESNQFSPEFICHAEPKLDPTSRRITLAVIRSNQRRTALAKRIVHKGRIEIENRFDLCFREHIGELKDLLAKSRDFRIETAGMRANRDTSVSKVREFIDRNTNVVQKQTACVITGNHYRGCSQRRNSGKSSIR
jgi:hypothetical protein